MQKLLLFCSIVVFGSRKIKLVDGYSRMDDSNIRCFYAYDEIKLNERQAKNYDRVVIQKPEKRLLSISGTTEDIEIKLELAVPFIKIPIKKDGGGVQLFPAKRSDRKGRVSISFFC